MRLEFSDPHPPERAVEPVQEPQEPVWFQETPTMGVYGAEGDWTLNELYQGGVDVNPDLSGPGKWPLYDEMRRSDPAVRSVLYMHKLPCRAATYTLEEASSDPIDLEIADACAQQFGLTSPVTKKEHDGWLDLSWDEWTGQSLLKLDFGSMFEEPIWGELREYTTPAGTTRDILPLARCAPRFPSRITTIKTDEKTGEIEYVEQDVPGTRRIPGSKIYPYTFEREGSNWYGTSMLRAMYGAWKLKKMMLIETAIGWYRFAAGMLIVRYPPEEKTAGLNRAKQIGRTWRTSERGYMALENDERWAVDVMNTNASLADPVPLLQYYDQQISEAGLLMMKELGQTAFGTQSLANVLADPYYLAVQAVAYSLVKERRKYAFRQFVDVNYGPEYEVPKLRVSKIQAQNLQLMSSVIATLAGVGFYFTDLETQNNVRSQMDLAQLPPELAAVPQAVSQVPGNVGIGAIGAEGGSIASGQPATVTG